MAEEQFSVLNPHLKYINARDHGYMLVTVYPDHTEARWLYVSTLKAINSVESPGKKLKIKKGSFSLQ